MADSQSPLARLSSALKGAASKKEEAAPAEAKTEAELEAEAKAKADAEPGTEAKTEAELEAEAKAKADAEPDTEAKTEAELEAEAQAKANPDTPAGDDPLSRIEALAGKVSDANHKLNAALSDNAQAKAEISELTVQVTQGKLKNDALKVMATELINVYHTRLGSQQASLEGKTTEELVAEYEGLQAKFNTAFPEGQTTDTSEEAHSSKADAGHSQRSHPISRRPRNK